MLVLRLPRLLFVVDCCVDTSIDASEEIGKRIFPLTVVTSMALLASMHNDIVTVAELGCILARYGH